VPHRHQPDPHQGRNGRSHLRHVVLVEEACHTKEDPHGEQPQAPQQQRVKLSIALQVPASLPGKSQDPKERQWQEPGDLPSQGIIEEAQRTRCTSPQEAAKSAWWLLLPCSLAAGSGRATISVRGESSRRGWRSRG
jgi:hypothetical protein